MIDVSGAFNGFLQSINVRREAAGTRSSTTGAWVPGAESKIQISAVVQNATPDEVMTLPEGERTKETIKIHSTELLATADEDNGIAADQIEYQGGLYKVMSVANRKTLGNYYKALAVYEGAL